MLFLSVIYANPIPPQPFKCTVTTTTSCYADLGGADHPSTLVHRIGGNDPAMSQEYCAG